MALSRMQWVILVMGLLAVFAPTAVEGAGGKGKEAKEEYVEVLLSAAFLEIGRAVWATGRNMAETKPGMKVRAPEKGMKVWAVWGSPVQRRALLPDVLPAVVMAVRRPVGIGASGPTVLVRWFDGSSAWTNVDFVNVYHREEDLESDQTAFDILWPEEAAAEVAAAAQPAAKGRGRVGQASAAAAPAAAEDPIDLNLFSEIEEVEERLAEAIEARDTAETDSQLWHERMQTAEENMEHSQQMVQGLTLQLNAAKDKLAANAKPRVAVASTQVEVQLVADAATQVEEPVVADAATQVEEPVVAGGPAADANPSSPAADADPSSQWGDTPGPRKRSKTEKYTPHDKLGKGGGAKHWKPASDGDAGGDPGAGPAVT